LALLAASPLLAQEATEGDAAATTTQDDDSDWGWIGLLGLAGLAGLAGRRRDNTVHTTTARH
jgi:MYXO-CTERM domain-containing protein